MPTATRSPRLARACVAFLTLLSFARTTAAAADPPAPPREATPDAWLAHARQSAPPAAVDPGSPHVRIAALVARMGQPDQAVAYLDQQYATLPRDRRRIPIASVPALLIEAGDGHAVAAYVTAAAKADYPIFQVCASAAQTLALRGQIEQAEAALRPLSLPANADARTDSGARDLQEAARILGGIKAALANPPAVPPDKPKYVQESGPTGYAMVIAPAQAQAGQFDRALKTVQDHIPAQQSTFRAWTYAGIARITARQPSPNPARLRAVLAQLEPLLEPDGPNLHMDDDGARLAAVEARARLGDRAGFERHVALFRKKHRSDLPGARVTIEMLLPHEVQGRLVLGDVAAAKAALDNFQPAPWADLNPLYAEVARHFAAAGKLDDARPWLTTLRGPEFKPDTYAHACAGVALGLWERTRAPAPAAK